MGDIGVGRDISSQLNEPLVCAWKLSIPFLALSSHVPHAVFVALELIN